MYAPFTHHPEIAAVVLAGGLGSRLRGVLGDTPKPMAIVNGQPFLHWIMKWIKKGGATDFVISTGYRGEVIDAYFRENTPSGCLVTVVGEDRQFGTGGGIRNAILRAGFFSRYWLVCNGDSIVITPVARLIECMCTKECDAVVLGINMCDTSRFGTLEIDKQQNLIGFREKQPGAGIINSGAYLLSDSLARTIPDTVPLSIERDVFPLWINAGKRIKVLTVDAPFIDIGIPESLALASDFIKQHASAFE